MKRHADNFCRTPTQPALIWLPPTGVSHVLLKDLFPAAPTISLYTQTSGDRRWGCSSLLRSSQWVLQCCSMKRLQIKDWFAAKVHSTLTHGPLDYLRTDHSLVTYCCQLIYNSEMVLQFNVLFKDWIYRNVSEVKHKNIYIIILKSENRSTG